MSGVTQERVERSQSLAPQAPAHGWFAGRREGGSYPCSAWPLEPPSPLTLVSSLSLQRVDLTVSGDSVTGIPQPPRIPSEATVGSKVRWTSAPRARWLWGSVDLARCTLSVPTCRAACPFGHGLTGNTALCPTHVHSPASASRPQPLGNGYVGPPGSLVPSRSAVLPTRVPSWLWRHEDALPCPSLPPGSQGTPCSAGAGTIPLAVHGLAHTGSGGGR